MRVVHYRMVPTEDELRKNDCWFPSTDRVTGQPAVTAFRQTARLRQASWRKSMALPRGSHISGGSEKDNGSRLAPEGLLQADRRNFLSDSIGDAVQFRSDAKNKETGQQLLQSRLRLDLLSSMPMCFNLFGELSNNPDRLTSAGSAHFGLAQPGLEVKFEHSPGRHDPRFTGDGTAFDVALFFGDEQGPRTVIGIETKYHEHAVAERRPDDAKLQRYLEIAESAQGVFKPGAEVRILGTELQQIWRDHLLLLSMLQAGAPHTAGKYVLVHPENNPAFRDAGRQYRECLDEDSTFVVMTIEDLLASGTLHDVSTAEKFAARYLW